MWRNMNYFLCKLHFTTPLHVGNSESAKSLDSSNMTICADTVFSALCHTALTTLGEDGIKKLYNYVIDNQLRISDMLPYSQDRLFIPKPFMTSKAIQVNNNKHKDRKKIKKLTHLPLDMLPDFLASIEGEKDFDVEKASCDFGIHHISTKNSIQGNDIAVPYIVGLFSFNQDSGLYIIIGYKSKEALQYILKLLRLTGISGIGGKVSSGYGKYKIIAEVALSQSDKEEFQNLSQLLNLKTAENYLLLTSSIPSNHELKDVIEGSSYGLIRRGGFVNSGNSGGKQVKKQTQYFFNSGSVLAKRFNGDIYNVSNQVKHPVYRYSKPIFMGLM